jgi:hypothetical protein
MMLRLGYRLTLIFTGVAIATLPLVWVYVLITVLTVLSLAGKFETWEREAFAPLRKETHGAQ